MVVELDAVGLLDPLAAFTSDACVTPVALAIFFGLPFSGAGQTFSVLSANSA